MNGKKIFAGVLAGTMVLGTFTVPVVAKDLGESYEATQKVASVATESTKLNGGTLTPEFFVPNTFSDALKLTNKPVTITFTNTSTDTSDVYFNAHYILYSSKSGAVYGGNSTDESYTMGKKNDMLEYIWVRGDCWAYCGQNGGTTSWTDAAVDSSKIENAKYPCTLTGVSVPWGTDTSAYAEIDDWAKATAKGSKGTITAYLDGGYAYVNYNLNGCQSLLKAKVDTSRTTYICIFGEPGKGKLTLSDLKYQYEEDKVSTAKLTLKKDSVVYNGKAQAPKVTLKDGSKDVTKSFKITYTLWNSTVSAKKIINTGLYVVAATGKAKTDYEGQTYTANYTITAAPQTVKIDNKTSVTKTYKASALSKKKATFSVKVSGAKNSNKTAKKYAVSTSKGVTAKVASGKITFTVPKGLAAGTYTMYIVAAADEKDPKNYAQSTAATVIIKVS